MSVRQHLIEAYDVIEELGGTIPEHRNIANLAAAIDSLPTSGSKTVTVTFHPKNGKDNIVKTIDKGQTVTPPTNPTKLGCTFDYWTTDNEFVIEPAPAGYHNVVFYKRNGEDPLVVQVKDGERLPFIAKPNKENSRFVQWTTDSDIKTVSFDPMNPDGSGKYSVDVVSGDTLEQPNGAHHWGCKFEGWYIKDEQENNNGNQI